MRSLVTGASGFIGKHLVAALVARGDQVRCLVRRTSAVAELQAMGVELAYGDVTDAQSVRQATEGVELVFHLAGLTAAFRRQDLMRVNGEGTAHVAWACAQQRRPPTLLLLSSLAAAGPAWPGRPRRESDRAAPISNYGRSKRAGELAAERWAGRVPITVVRPAIVFGPGDRMTLPMFAAIDRLGVHAVAGMVSPPLSLIHVTDLVPLILRAAQQGERLIVPDATEANTGQGYYFACCDEHPNYEQLGVMIGQALGRRAVILRVPSPLYWLVAGGNQLAARLRGRPDGLNVDKIREATACSWVCSGEKARRQLGFKPAEPLAVRLRQTAAWYRHRGWL